MSTRTTRVFRDEGLFEFLESGPVLIDRLEGDGPRQHIRTAFAFTISLLFGAVTLMGGENNQETFTYFFGGITILASMNFLRQFYRSLFGGKRRTRSGRGPLPIIISNEGVEQPIKDGATTALHWKDIRLVRKKDDVQSVRGTDKKISIDISNRLAWHEEATAIIKFLFVLRQEMGHEWDGAVPGMQLRLSGKGLPIHSRSSRKSLVVFSKAGMSSQNDKGDKAELSWNEIDHSIYEVKKNKILIKHVQSRTTLEVPADIESPILFDQLLRWGLHSDPVFGIKG